MYYQKKISVIKTFDNCAVSKADLWAIKKINPNNT